MISDKLIHYRPYVKRRKGVKTTKFRNKVNCPLCLDRIDLAISQRR